MGVSAGHEERGHEAQGQKRGEGDLGRADGLPAGQGRGHAQEQGDGQVLEDQHPEHQVGLVVREPAQVEQGARDDAAARDVDEAGDEHGLRTGAGERQPQQQAEPPVDQEVDRPPDEHQPPGLGEPLDRELEAQEEQQQHDPDAGEDVDALRLLHHAEEAGLVRPQHDAGADPDGDRRDPEPSRQQAGGGQHGEDDREVGEVEQVVPSRAAEPAYRPPTAPGVTAPA